jgi:hypothetical protein
MGWAEERAKLLSGDVAEVYSEAVPYPLPVKWGRQRGDIAVQDPETGEWHEMSYDDATPVWKAALRRKVDG